MTETSLSAWIRNNLGPIIIDSLTQSGSDIVYTPDLIGAMAQRETGFKMMKIFNKQPAITLPELSEQMKGDWSQRPGEIAEQYHGFGFWQIDIKSFPDFVNSGDWRDPRKCCDMAVKVLLSKRHFLRDKMPGLTGEQLDRANVAAYNCGEGRVMAAILGHQDVDSKTFNKDYSAEVWRYRELYKAAG